MEGSTVDAPYVIIGGDAAGMSAASKITREQPDAKVIVFERSQHISYSACGMPYWIGGTVDSDHKLLVLTPEVARKKRGIDVRIYHEVIAIDPDQHIVHVVNQKTSESFSQPYSKLCIATGARAIYPPIPGVDLPGVFTLRALSDAQRIHAYMREHPMKAAVIIGGGYVGVEMVEAMRDRQLEAHLVEAQAHIMPNYDVDVVAPITAHLKEKQVYLHLGTEVSAIKVQGKRLAIYIRKHVGKDTGKDTGKDIDQIDKGADKDGVIDADIVIVSVGIRPNSELAAAAGLRLGESNAIHVDRHLRTSAKDVFAAGDCVEHHHLVLERNVWIPLATSANKGGRIAGENMLGGNATLPGILGTAIVKVFDYTMANTGLNEVEARESGLYGSEGEFVGSTVIETKDKSNYWPGAQTLMIKLVFDKRGGRVLGSQMVGKDGVNKRIDIVATAITAKMTLRDLTMLDLSYAPPYSTSHDPIQVCASVAQRELIRESIP